MEERLSGRRARRQAPNVWAAAHVLLGLYHEPAVVAQLLRGVEAMKESSTYQAILGEGEAKGAVNEARKMLRKSGDRRYGPPDARAARAIDDITDLERLERLCEQLDTAANWQELLGLPAPTRRRGRRQSP
jgi:hypothetical protein